MTFQSPSLRGSGRFWRAWQAETRAPPSFNPLHCGAVVASSVSSSTRWTTLQFQSPSLRGSGRFLQRCPAP